MDPAGYDILPVSVRMVPKEESSGSHDRQFRRWCTSICTRLRTRKLRYVPITESNARAHERSHETKTIRVTIWRTLFFLFVAVLCCRCTNEHRIIRVALQTQPICSFCIPQNNHLHTPKPIIGLVFYCREVTAVVRFDECKSADETESCHKIIRLTIETHTSAGRRRTETVTPILGRRCSSQLLISSDLPLCFWWSRRS